MYHNHLTQGLLPTYEITPESRKSHVRKLDYWTLLISYNTSADRTYFKAWNASYIFIIKLTFGILVMVNLTVLQLKIYAFPHSQPYITDKKNF